MAFGKTYTDFTNESVSLRREYTMADAVFLTLLFIHIIFVVAWLGASLFGNIVLFPLMPKLSVQGRSDFSKLVVPRVFRYGLIAGTIALTDGVLLYVYINVTNTSNETSSLGQPLIQAGAVIGLVALIVVNAIQNNSMRHIQRVSAQTVSQVARGTSSSAQTSDDSTLTIGLLQNRLKITARLGATLLVIVVILMVVGSNI